MADVAAWNTVAQKFAHDGRTDVEVVGLGGDLSGFRVPRRRPKSPAASSLVCAADRVIGEIVVERGPGLIARECGIRSYRPRRP